MQRLARIDAAVGLVFESPQARFFFMPVLFVRVVRGIFFMLDY